MSNEDNVVENIQESDVDISALLPNNGKNRTIETEFGNYDRYPIKTHVIKNDDNMTDVVDKYAAKYLKNDDYLFISEKIVAISQGRAFKIEDIKTGFWANFLSKFVYKSPYGIGLGMPCTMQLAIDEIGLPRILWASLCSAVTKLFGVRGVFYKILGERARAIDGPCDCTIPPYNGYAKLAPDRPDDVAKQLSTNLATKVVIIDANDLGVEVLGRSDESIDIDFCKKVFSDNPLDQSAQQTPLCVVREVK